MQVDFRLVDTRDYLLPQRRNRVWIAGARGLDSNTQECVRKAMDTFITLGHTSHCPLDMFLTSLVAPRVPTGQREQLCLKHMCGKHLDIDSEDKDVFLDLAKSVYRTDMCDGAITCVRPNSKIWSVKRKRYITPKEKLMCQGVFLEDFPFLDAFCQQHAPLCADLAGNAFSASVCIALFLSLLAHLPGIAEQAVALDSRLQVECLVKPVECLVKPRTSNHRMSQMSTRFRDRRSSALPHHAPKKGNAKWENALIHSDVMDGIPWV